MNESGVRGRALAVVAGLMLIAPAASAQLPDDPRYPPEALPPVLVFADTSGARVEVRVRDGASMAGRTLHASLRNAGTGDVVWTGSLGALRGSGGDAVLSARVEGMQRPPARWSPQSPNLHELEVHGDGFRHSVRFGFRTFSTSDGLLYLNGRRIFLRGNAINPPERNLPDSLSENPRFAREYLQYLRSINVNIIRLTRPSEAWFRAADEVGMMIFQGHYGTPPGGSSTSPPRDTDAAIRYYTDRILGPQVNHPSVVIYALSNEQAAPEISYLSRGHREVARFLQTLHDTLRRWDDNRLYIGNDGYGFGRAGEICDLHRYWGWYYNTALSFYTLRDPRICWRSDSPQPITLTENTGNYTAPDGRFNLVSGTKQPESQLNWTGHAPDAEQAPRALAYQAWVAKQAIEITRRMRARNRHLAGLMPFSIIFHDWWGITRFADMRPKPIAQQYAVSFQPVLLSLELWTGQVYAGSTLRPVVHVVNDGERGEDLQGLSVRYEIIDANGAMHAHGERMLPDVPYFAARGTPLRIPLPGALRTGTYTLSAALRRGADTLSRNSTPVFIASRGYARAATAVATATATKPATRRLHVVDRGGATRDALASLGVAARTISASRIPALDPAADALIVGAGTWDTAMDTHTTALRRFVTAGGRVIILAQDADAFDGAWLPAAVKLQTEPVDHPLLYPEGRPYRNGMAVNPERPDHPVLAGIDRDRLFLWSDWTRWSDTMPDFPEVYPVTSGFRILDPDAFERVNILASYDHGLEGVALAEIHDGRGSFVLSGFGLVPRAGLDPVADRMLVNLARYAATASPHPPHPLIDSEIRWGDHASERGTVPEIYSGFVLHTEPRVPPTLAAAFPGRYDRDVDANGFHFAGTRGGWNTHPSVQYVGAGRRPFGPYRFTLGGAVQLPPGSAAEGVGRVWMRLPPGRTMMHTTITNPDTAVHQVAISVNGVTSSHPVPAGATVDVETAIPRGTATIALHFRGDRRLIIRRTGFR